MSSNSAVLRSLRNAGPPSEKSDPPPLFELRSDQRVSLVYKTRGSHLVRLQESLRRRILSSSPRIIVCRARDTSNAPPFLSRLRSFRTMSSSTSQPRGMVLLSPPPAEDPPLSESFGKRVSSLKSLDSQPPSHSSPPPHGRQALEVWLDPRWATACGEALSAPFSSAPCIPRNPSLSREETFPVSRIRSAPYMSLEPPRIDTLFSFVIRG